MAPGKPVLTGSSVEIVTWGVSNVAKGMTQALLQVFGNFDRIGSMGFASPIAAYLAAGRRTEALVC